MPEYKLLPGPRLERKSWVYGKLVLRAEHATWTSKQLRKAMREYRHGSA